MFQRGVYGDLEGVRVVQLSNSFYKEIFPVLPLVVKRSDGPKQSNDQPPELDIDAYRNLIGKEMHSRRQHVRTCWLTLIRSLVM